MSRQGCHKRPSAKMLLQHRWFNDFVAENILETLASTQADGVVVDHKTDSSTILNLVESNILSKCTEQREEWLRSGCLKKVVAILPKVTPDLSYEIIKVFATAAQECRSVPSSFLTQLGETDFWDCSNLSSQGEAESLGSLFVSCCESQDPKVAQYAPTHQGALVSLLTCEKVDVAVKCINALHALLVGRADGEEGESTFPAAASPEHVPTNVDNYTFRRYLSQNRFVADNVVPAFQHIIEYFCRNALYEEKEPPVGWASVDKLFGILVQVHNKTGHERIVLGPSACRVANNSTTESMVAGL
ncbi:hypothetical protein ERJ75_000522400 [Trypanosoma vivax]|nr:hypothetical protein ERJ75_000522400 [Trypanosoma vivax]